MWQLRRSEILHKAVQLGNRRQVPLLSVATCTHLQLPLQVPLTDASYRYLHLATSIQVPVTVQVSGLTRSGSSNIRSYHSTNVVQQNESKDSQSSSAASTPPAEGEDAVPDMQKESDNQDNLQHADTQEPPHPTDIVYSFTPPPALSTESLAKVDDLFQKIIWLDMIEVHLLTQLVQEKMSGN